MSPSAETGAPGQSWRDTLGDVLVGLLVAALLGGPAMVRGELIGSPRAELYGHAWVQWWASLSWPSLPTGTTLALSTESWPVIDPLPTWFAAGISAAISAGLDPTVGAVVGWNAWVVLGLVLAAIGGGALVRACGGAGRIGALGLSMAPILLGSVQSGLTEDLGIGVVALALAVMVRGRPLLGGLLLGISAGFGLYLGYLGAFGALGIGLSRLWRALRHDRPGATRFGSFGRELGRWSLGATLALGLAGLFVAPFWGRLGESGSGRAVVRDEPLWRVNPWRGADLASYFVPGKVETDATMIREHPVYLGWVPVGLAALELGALGGWHPAALGLGLAMVLAPGEDLSFAGRPLGVKNPIMVLFSRVPLADRLHHHARIMLVGQLGLLVLAGRGARRLRGAWPRVVPLLLGLEVVMLSPASTPIAGTPPASPVVYARLAELPDGPVVVLPASGPGVHPQKVLYDQRAHGRRLLHDPNRPERRPPPTPGAWIVVLAGPPPPGLGDPVIIEGESRIYRAE